MAVSTGMTAVERRVLALCRERKEGLSNDDLLAELPDVAATDWAAAINTLSSRRLIEILRRGDTLLYKELDRQEAAKLKGLASEDLLVYQIIQQSGNMGIWTKDMKSRSNLPQPQITKIIKTLEGRRLIKAVKSVASKNRKVYMLEELEPSREITGGAWYSGQEFDTEFINVLRQQCLQLVLRKAPITLKEIAEEVQRSGVTKEELQLDDYRQVVNTLVYDGELEAHVSVVGGGREADIPLGAEYYKPSKFRVPESSHFTNIPCGVCPVLHECTDDGLVSPKTCVYFQDWLQF